jgi:hypothetical protein
MCMDVQSLLPQSLLTICTMLPNTKIADVPPLGCNIATDVTTQLMFQLHCHLGCSATAHGHHYCSPCTSSSPGCYCTSLPSQGIVTICARFFSCRWILVHLCQALRPCFYSVGVPEQTGMMTERIRSPNGGLP